MVLSLRMKLVLIGVSVDSSFCAQCNKCRTISPPVKSIPWSLAQTFVQPPPGYDIDGLQIVNPWSSNYKSCRNYMDKPSHIFTYGAYLFAAVALSYYPYNLSFISKPRILIWSFQYTH